MADSTVTALTGAAALDGTELFYGVQSAADRKVTADQIKTWASGGTLTATVTVTSAEIKNCFTSAKTIIAAPGAGKMIQVLDWMLEYDYGTVAYSVPSEMFLTFAGGGDAVQITDSPTYFMSDSADKVAFPGSHYPSLSGVKGFVFSRSATENKALTIVATVGNPTLGDGTLYVTVRYLIYTFLS